MIASLVLALSACSTPEAPMHAAAPSPAPVAAPVPQPPAMPPGMVMPADMPMPAAGQTEGKPGEEAEGAALPPTVIPESSAAIVTAMQEKRSAIKALLDAGKLKEVHPVAKQLMDLATALPGKSGTLAAADKGTLTMKCMDIKEKADELHDKADEGDAAGAKSAFALVSADVDAIVAVAK